MHPSSLHIFSFGMLRLLILPILLFSASSCFSQTDTTLKKNALYIELAGVAGNNSVNYERAIKLKPKLDINLRAGIGIFDITDFNNNFNPNITVPLMAGLKYGKRHYAEIGAGETISNTVDAESASGDAVRSTYLSTVFSFGYRYQKENGGFLVRAAYTPIIEFNETFTHWGGVSIGFMF